MSKVGSARRDENGKYVNGVPGDQDKLEVAEQTFYMHKKGWYALRPKSTIVANKLAQAMKDACNNQNIGYSQSDRYSVISKLRTYGTLANIKTVCNADCSSLVRACCIEVGFDPGDFNTSTELTVLNRLNIFEDKFAVTDSTKLCTGDILVTKTKGHTVIVTEGEPRTTNLSPAYTLGIDVSSYNGDIDWNKVKAEGWQFAILKVIRKDLSADKKFEQNWKGCVEAGMPIHCVYNYLYAKSVLDAEKSATAVLNVLGPDRHPTVCLDYEADSLPKDRTAADIINAYGDIITAAGCKFMIYFGMSYYNSYLSKIMQYVKPEYKVGWEARYYDGYNTKTINSAVDMKSCPTHFDGTLYGWQYSSAGSVSGITGRVDLNAWFVETEANKLFSEDTYQYTEEQFIKDSRKIFGVSATASANEIVEKTVTISTQHNQRHAMVTPLERYMKSLGYYTGTIEADVNKTPNFGNGMKKAIMLYQQNIVKATPKNCDGILTVKGKTWKTLYGAR